MILEDMGLVVLGSSLAIASGVVTQFFIHWLTTRHERRSLAQAFAGEIGAIIDIIEYRKYLQGVEKTIKYVDEQKQTCNFLVGIRQNYFQVYESNINRVGLLPNELPCEIAKFYTYAKSLIEDVTDSTRVYSNYTDCLEALTDMKDMFEKLNSIGKQLVIQLKQV